MSYQLPAGKGCLLQHVYEPEFCKTQTGFSYMTGKGVNAPCSTYEYNGSLATKDHVKALCMMHGGTWQDHVFGDEPIGGVYIDQCCISIPKSKK